MPSNKIYLGDSVYAALEPETGMVRLFTDNGFGERSQIYLEPEVMRALINYLQIVLEGPVKANDN